MRLWCVVAPATTHNNYHRLCRDDPFYAQAGAVDLEYQTLLHITASTFVDRLKAAVESKTAANVEGAEELIRR